MLRSLFKSKSQIRLDMVRAATADLERFVLSLKGMSAEEIGTVVAMAATVRMELRHLNEFPDAALGIGIPLLEAEMDLLRRKLASLALNWQKRNYATTVGAMVWAHTLRAYCFPEVRLLGRQMWGELERGFSHALDALQFMEDARGQQPPLGSMQATQFIPVGLEPFEETA